MLYKKVDPTSLDAMPGGLDLFTSPFTQVAIERTFEREFLTLNPHTQPPFHFKVLTGTSFMDGRKTRLVTRWKLMKKTTGSDTWVNVKDTDNVVSINGIGACFIKDLKISANGQLVSDSNNLYLYKAYLDNLIHFPEDVKKSSLNTFGWYHDDEPKSNLMIPVNATVNTEHATTKIKPIDAWPTGWKDRRNLWVGGNIVEFSAPLYADILQQPNLLLSNMEFQFTISPHEVDTLFIKPADSTDEYRRELVGIRLYCTFVDLHPGVALEIEKRLAKEPARYPLRRHELKTQFFDIMNTEVHNVLFSDFIPRQLYVLMVDQESYVGHIKKDPTYFGHFKIRSMQVKAGNMEIPSVMWDLNMDPSSKDMKYVRAYEHLHRTIGLAGANLDCGISRKMYLDGYTIWAFNLTTTQEDDEGFDFIRDGVTMLHTFFNEAIAGTGIMAIVIGVFDAMMFIDFTRTIRTDLSI